MRRQNTEKAGFEYLSPLIKFLGRQKAFLFIAIICAVAGTIITIIGPSFVSRIADIIADGLSSVIDTDSIMKLGLILAGLYILGWIFNFLQARLMNVVT